MSILDRLFRRERTRTKTELINEPVSGFSMYGGDAYSNDIFREAVDAIARNAGKLKGSHVVTYAGERHETIDGRLNRLLQTRPNRYMSSYDFLYKLTTRLFLYNNAFAYIDRDERGNVRALYPITATHVDILSDATGSLFCGFMLRDGREVTLPYDDIVHLRRFFNENEILGEDNTAIASGIELAQTQNDGITSAIRAGASIRGILSFTQIMSPTKLKEEKDAFVKDYLELGNEGGVIATDQKMSYTPIDHKPVLLDADQAKEIKTKIYNYLGLTESIVNSSYTEDEYAAFYESTLEPIAIALSQEFTAKVFNDREQAFGNSIVFESGRLQFTSNKTKVSLIAQLAPYGLLTINQALEILNLPSVADGDKRLQALNMIDQSIATEYQLGKKPDNRLKEGSDDE
uniref:Portal protein n=1 Tax=Myoviridae sp. ctrEx11 TaxID=2825180 RepID=A0A8S5V5G7_9CAUD|nr:MAG TPA: portal protein [Myoviridae sp. ctrEx11]